MSHYFTPIRIALIVALVLVLIAGIVLVPADAMLPIHWGLSGEADRFMPRDAALLMPVLLVVAVWGILYFAAKITPPSNVAAGRYGLGVALTGLTALGLVLEVVLVLIGIGVAVDMVQVIAIALGTLMVLIGNALPKSQPNYLVGIRLPSTLRSAANWQATHRLTGMLAMAGGVALIVAALFVSAPGLIWWVLGCVIGPVLVGCIYSLSIAPK